MPHPPKRRRVGESIFLTHPHSNMEGGASPQEDAAAAAEAAAESAAVAAVPDGVDIGWYLLKEVAFF